MYSYFSDTNIWPRGLPLTSVRSSVVPLDDLLVASLDCPIQQGLADGDPDVDAIYRLLNPHPTTFSPDRRVALGNSTWCPFNSQNTTWWSDTFPLLYLPAHCSFRMTDIWRSFVSQRICWENGWSVLFHSPTVFQHRNEHDLLKDFRDEIPGYLNADRLSQILAKLSLTGRLLGIADDMRRCYDALTSEGLVGTEEPALLDAWLQDIAAIDASKAG